MVFAENLIFRKFYTFYQNFRKTVGHVVKISRKITKNGRNTQVEKWHLPRKLHIYITFCRKSGFAKRRKTRNFRKIGNFRQSTPREIFENLRNLQNLQKFAKICKNL